MTSTTQMTILKRCCPCPDFASLTLEFALQLTGETEVLGEKPVTVPLCPPYKAALPGIEPGCPN